MDNGNGIAYLLVYLDSKPIFAKSLELCEKLKDILSQAFQVHDLGDVRYSLGINITRNKIDRIMKLAQTQ